MFTCSSNLTDDGVIYLIISNIFVERVVIIAAFIYMTVKVVHSWDFDFFFTIVRKAREVEIFGRIFFKSNFHSYICCSAFYVKITQGLLYI